MSIEAYYRERENCLRDLSAARQTITNRNTTSEEWDGVDKGLGLMLFYCPEDLADVVRATLMESTQRRAMTIGL